ncbi:MAG: tRNA (guanosine(37)-N1)-methyltransferase TrmD [Geobacteraceae bacterium]|nr:tRNA (guanosine(37)-N1)-methyltransferase TrmD [Geobacteraceae bacterium]
MKFHILTLFPEMFSGVLSLGVTGRAVENGILGVSLYNIRDYTTDRHRTVDDTPYGGGAGMVMKVEPIVACIEEVRKCAPSAKILLASPGGRPFDQKMAEDLAAEGEVIILCGRYEGVDERIKELFAAIEFSIGDYVMTGGEIAAMAVVDTVGRLIPGVLGSSESATEESFSEGLLEYPQYTRPAEFRGMKVPDVLLSGNHSDIAKWRRVKSLEKTGDVRPDLLIGMNR